MKLIYITHIGIKGNKSWSFWLLIWNTYLATHLNMLTKVDSIIRWSYFWLHQSWVQIWFFPVLACPTYQMFQLWTFWWPSPVQSGRTFLTSYRQPWRHYNKLPGKLTNQERQSFFFTIYYLSSKITASLRIKAHVIFWSLWAYLGEQWPVCLTNLTVFRDCKGFPVSSRSCGSIEDGS